MGCGVVQQGRHSRHGVPVYVSFVRLTAIFCDETILGAPKLDLEEEYVGGLADRKLLGGHRGALEALPNGTLGLRYPILRAEGDKQSCSRHIFISLEVVRRKQRACSLFGMGGGVGSVI